MTSIKHPLVINIFPGILKILPEYFKRGLTTFNWSQTMNESQLIFIRFQLIFNRVFNSMSINFNWNLNSISIDFQSNFYFDVN